MTAFELVSESGLVPLFPLPDHCLLPGELQAFHIFEPRYRALLADALAGENLIALPRLLPGWSGGYFAHPAVKPVFGVGQVVSHVTKPDGTSDIVLQGIARVRLVEVLRESPYRLARVAELPEPVSDPKRLGAVWGDLKDLLDRAATDLSSACYRNSTHQAPAVELAGRLARLIRFDSDWKQRMLETDDLAERLGLLLDCLRSGQCSPLERASAFSTRIRNPFFN